MRILCNKCNKPLGVSELAYYPLQWQYSGDMYCHKHETRSQFKSPVRASEAYERTKHLTEQDIQED